MTAPIPGGKVHPMTEADTTHRAPAETGSRVHRQQSNL